VTSLLTQQTLPANVDQVMRRMHLPEALNRQAYRAVTWSGAPERGRRPGGR
jgi:hypothetical protein